MLQEAGRIVGGRYLLVELLGEGGMGSVWRATDTRRDIDVAVKLLRAGAPSRDAVRALFAQEAELSQRMLSRHIVRVLDRGIDPDGIPFIVFELLDGEDLGKRLDRLVSLPLVECAEVVVQVCRALERAHAIGAVHRDIKPENIFHCPDEGLYKVLDFGIARLVTSAAPQGGTPTLSGTIEHMPPEHVVDGKECDARGDLYALGVVAYRAMTSRLPFPASNIGQLVLAFSRGAPPPPSTVRPEIPRAFDSWIERALRRNPEDRFQTAREMADAFTRTYGRPSPRVSMTMEAVTLGKGFGSSGVYSAISPSSRDRKRGD